MRRRREKISIRLMFICFFLILAGGYIAKTYMGPATGANSPADALAQAAAQLTGKKEPSKEETSLSLLEYAAGEKDISHWALLLQGQHYEAAGKEDLAIATYKQIAEASAASLDAKLAILRLAPSPEVESGHAAEFGRFVSQLEQDIRVARRKDLMPELQFLKARAAEQHNDLTLALALYRQVRREYVGQDAARKAREALARLEASAGKNVPRRSIAELLAETELLLREKLNDQALETVQQAKQQTTSQAPAYYEALLMEEDVLRRSGRTEEANRVLAVVSADGALGTADRALLKMARLAWNANDQSHALQYIDRFEKRFPSSDQYDEALYVKARVLEEDNKNADAKEAYLQLIAHSSNQLSSLRALRQIAWIHMRNSEFASAAEFFFKAKTRAEQLVTAERSSRAMSDVSKPDQRPVSSGKQLREALDELNHAAFWTGFSVTKLDAKEQKKLNFTIPTPEAIYKELEESAPYGYYRFLAEQVLIPKESIHPLPAQLDAGARGSCLKEVPELLKRRLEILGKAGLLDFSRFEIDWHFAKQQDLALMNPILEADKAPGDSRLREELTRASLYAAYAQVNRSIGFAEEVLSGRSPYSFASAELRSCAPLLYELSFPLSYLDLFNVAGNKTGVPPATLLAIARTESHFDPLAVSSKNAAGLLQMLQKTAEQEGLLPEDNLFSPEVNIRLGAQHFARLLKQHSGKEYLAVAAYNAGATAVDRWLNRYSQVAPESWVELISYPETKSYVKEVMRAKYFYEKRLAQEAAKMPLQQQNAASDAPR